MRLLTRYNSSNNQYLAEKKKALFPHASLIYSTILDETLNYLYPLSNIFLTFTPRVHLCTHFLKTIICEVKFYFATIKQKQKRC